jgi:hypothetical protein
MVCVSRNIASKSSIADVIVKVLNPVPFRPDPIYDLKGSYLKRSKPRGGPECQIKENLFVGD